MVHATDQDQSRAAGAPGDRLDGRRLYRGSCHCGAVAFECEVDLATETTRCNCSICSKGRFWKAIVPAAQFRVLRGENVLTEYRFGSGTISHRFCSICGIKPFGAGDIPHLGPFYAVNIACLEGLSDAERAAIPIRYEDGREGDYGHAPAETRYL